MPRDGYVLLRYVAVLWVLCASVALPVPSEAQEANGGTSVAGGATEAGPTATLFLTNGDHARGRLESLVEGKLAFRPDVAPQSVLLVELAEVATITFAQVTGEQPTESEELRLRGGSVLHGTLVGLTEGSLRFDAVDFGLIELPRAAIEMLSKPAPSPVKAEPQSEHHVLVTTQGDLLTGNLEQANGGALLIRGETIEVAVPYSAVASILFPRRDEGGEPGNAEERICKVKTLSGARVIGRDPQIDAGRFSMTLMCDRKVGLPLERVAEITLSRRGKTLTLDLGGDVKMELALIPAGEFMMGSAHGLGREKPVHRVRITKPFYMAVTEVTQAQWRAVMEGDAWGGKQSVGRSSDAAANHISWSDAVRFCQALSKKTEGTVRLPTEAEWEYACRAGTVTEYCFGDDIGRLGEYAWYKKNAQDVGEDYPHRVAQKKPNAWGLYDMHGNVWEWCQDWYVERYYGNSPTDDPSGPATGQSHVMRGSCWFSVDGRSAYRYTFPGTLRKVGFRVVCEPWP